MRKHRKWLMGFGIGIILGACMLQLMNFARAQDDAILKVTGELTRTELDQAAKQQGLALRPADEKTYTKKQMDEQAAKAVAAAQKSAPPSASSAASDSKANPKNRTVNLYVKYNTSLEEAAWKLEALEVIQDADDFISKAYDIRKQLAIGTSTFKGQPTYKQIMDELTRDKKNN